MPFVEKILIEGNFSKALGLEDIAFTKKDFSSDLIEIVLEERYSFQIFDTMKLKDHLNSYMWKMDYDKKIVDYVRSTLPSNTDENQKDFSLIAMCITDKRKESPTEELYEAAEIIVNSIEKNDPKGFYFAGISAYQRAMYRLEKFTEKSAFFFTDVKPMLKSNNSFLKLKDLAKMSGREIHSLFYNFPIDFKNKIINDGSLLISDVDDLDKMVSDFDEKRNKLHKKLLSIGKEHLEKDYVDVYLDIMCKISEGAQFYAMQSTGNLLIGFGLIQIDSTMLPEKRRYYGDTELDVTVYYDALEKEGGYFPPSYRSYFNESEDEDSMRTQEQDDKIMEAVENKYSDYVIYKGDYFTHSMHARAFFEKTIEIDVSKIKKNEKDPNKMLKGINDYIVELSKN